MAQEFPTAGGYNQLPQGVFIPDIFSMKLLARYYEQTLVPQLVNFDYEGEIRSMGDKVKIRRVPEVTVSRYFAGMELVRQVINDEEVEFIIDFGAYWNVPVDDVQNKQADVRWAAELTDNAIIQHKRFVDQQVLGLIYADADSGNVLANLTVSANNLPQAVVDFRVTLNEAFAPDVNRWYVIPYYLGGLFLLNPTFIRADVMGDSESMIRYGRIGTMGNAVIFESPNLATVGGHDQVLCGTPTAVTFATQFTKTETLRNPNAFGDLIRGLQIFGWKTVQATHLSKRGMVQAS